MLVVFFDSAPVVDHLDCDVPRLTERHGLTPVLVHANLLEVVVHDILLFVVILGIADQTTDLIPEILPLPEQGLLGTAQVVVLLLELGHLIPEMFLQVAVVLFQLPVLLVELGHLLPELADGSGGDHHPKRDEDADEDGDDEEHAVHC